MGRYAANSMSDYVKISAVLLAGERPGGDPLARAFGVPAKALVPVAGEAMGARVARALAAASDLGSVRIFGNPAAMAALGDIVVEAAGPTIAATVRPLIETMDGPLLITTADHPLLDMAMLAGFIAGARGQDLAMGVVERRVLIAAYPGNRRTWLRFRKGAWSGANLFWIGSRRVLPILEAWARVEQRRKRGWALIGAFGPLLLAGVALRLLTLQGALDRLGRRHGLRIKAVALAQPEACIDVDSLADHALVERIIRNRG